MSQANPLITVIIITYNSAEYITEALESVMQQTYPDIELVVSDDCSKDDTVSICKTWITVNNQRFKRAAVVTTEQNTGTSANLNRALKNSTGEWIKVIAGDDYLYPESLQAFMDEANTDPSIEFIFSDVAVNGEVAPNKELEAFFQSQENQYTLLLKNSIMPAPGAFIKKDTMLKAGGFNEKYKLFDDFPFFLSALKSGVRFHYLKKPLVFYRVHETNVSHDQKFSIKYINDVKNFFGDVYLKELRKNKLYIHYGHYCLQYILLKLVSAGIIQRPATFRWILNWGSVLNWKNRIQNKIKSKPVHS